MRLDSRFRKLAALLPLAGLIAALAGTGSAPAASSSAAGCTPSKNVEAIIDDSGSMNGSDPSNFRAKLMSAYIGLGGNQGKTLGAVKFSSDASVLFGPQAINGGTRSLMEGAFNTLLINEGGTDYDAGFTLGNSQNPGATSRIFLSDGALGTDTDLHRTPPTKTYVVGLGVGSDTSAVTELTQIASETGGPPPLFVEDAGQLQAAAGIITAGQNCKKLVTYTDQVNKTGDAFKHGFKAQSKVADILTSWGAIGDVIDIALAGPGTKKASISKVRIKKTKGLTFVSARVKGLKKGQKVKFKVQGKKVITPTTATTQVIR
jgi:hypothetical protein